MSKFRPLTGRMYSFSPQASELLSRVSPMSELHFEEFALQSLQSVFESLLRSK